MKASFKCFKCMERHSCQIYLKELKNIQVIDQSELDHLLGKTNNVMATVKSE